MTKSTVFALSLTISPLACGPTTTVSDGGGDLAARDHDLAARGDGAAHDSLSVGDGAARDLGGASSDGTMLDLARVVGDAATAKDLAVAVGDAATAKDLAVAVGDAATAKDLAVAVVDAATAKDLAMVVVDAATAKDLAMVVGDAATAKDLAMVVGDAALPRDLAVAVDAALPHDLGAVGDAAVQQSSYFPAGAVWTTDITNAAADAESAAVVNWLNGVGWGNGGHFQIDLSFHILQANGNTPRLPFHAAQGYYLPDCDVAANVPIPTVGAIEGEAGYSCTSMGDCHLLVVDRGAGKLYEMYQAGIANQIVSSTCLVVWDLTRVYPPSGRGDQCTSTDAAGYPVAPLLFTADEVAAGHIDHAVRFALPNPSIRAGVYVHPATHAGGPSGPMTAPPYGARLRLRPDYPVDMLPSATAKVVARALQKYGMLLADGGQIALMGQDDRFTQAKWANLLVTARDLDAIKPGDFTMVDGGPRIPLTYNCVRNP